MLELLVALCYSANMPSGCTEIVRAWPSDEQIAESIRKHQGVLLLAARELLVRQDDLSAHVQRKPELMEQLQDTIAAGEAYADYHLRKMTAEGNLGAIGMSLHRRKILAELGQASSANAGASTGAVDYTREVDDPKLFTDAELSAQFRRLSLGNPPAPGERCPCCGRVVDAAPEDATPA